jgi:uncharacterized protein
VNETHKGYVSNRILKMQVGYLLNETKGFSRETEFDIPTLRVSDDMTLDYLRGSLKMSRTSRGILVQGVLHTSIEAECNRCLNETWVDLDVPIEEVYVYPPEADSEYNVGDDGILDLAPLVREEVILVTPLGILCKSDCAGLCPNCGENLNDGPCGCDQDNIDPRFNVLKDLRDKMSKD